MKRFSLLLSVAALCGLPHVSANSADFAQAEFKLKASEAQVEQVVPRVEYFAGKETNKAINPAWHYVRIPYVLEGKCKDADKLPLYVDELKVHVYLVFAIGKDGEKDKNLTMLDKEITYVNIPLTPKTGAGKSENKNVQAAVFISPSDAARICADGSNKVSKVDLKGKLLAVAAEFKFKDKDCIKPDTEQCVYVGKNAKKDLAPKWWTKQDKKGVGAKLCAISETPFAPFYAPMFPPTSPMYGSSSAGPVDFAPAPAMDSDLSADTTSSATGSTKKKNKRNSK